MRFTMGKGPSGLEREAYYAGWLVVGYWLEHGTTFAEIARIPEAEMPKAGRRGHSKASRPGNAGTLK